jgi:hypothetical protein
VPIVLFDERIDVKVRIKNRINPVAKKCRWMIRF